MAQKKKPAAKKTASGKTQTSKNNSKTAVTALCVLAVSLLLALCTYVPQVCGMIGDGVKGFMISIFGIPAILFPIILAALGIYLTVKRDLKKFIIKSVFSLIALALFCGLFYIFGAENVRPWFSGGIPHIFEGGCGYLGLASAYWGVEWFGRVISAIIHIVLIICLISLIFKISFIRLIAGFFESTKDEAGEIRAEQSYEAGRRARKAVNDAASSTLTTLKQHSIDFDVDDIKEKGKKEKKKKKKDRLEEEQKAIEKIGDSSDIGDIDVPFDVNSKEKNTDAEADGSETIDDILSRVDFETGEILDEQEEEPIVYTGDKYSDENPSPNEQKFTRAEPLSAEQDKDLRRQMDEGAFAEPIPYKFPDVKILSPSPAKKSTDVREELSETAHKLVATLKSFGVDVTLSNVSRGPSVTRFELQPSVGVKVSKITNLSDDIALNLAATSVRIEAPIPGKAAIGIEIPNKEKSMVSLREVIESDEFKNAKSKLSVAMGMDITGRPVISDIAKMPHVLIAGTTGSGKSVCINSIVTSILYKADPNEVKLIMVDPKKVELEVYNGIPHLLIPVVTEPKKASGALGWAVSEMMRRYDLFAENGVRNLEGYNEAMELEGEAKLPQIVIIVDELADLMMVAPKEIEDSICRLAQMARAAGMHLIIATQRPSANVITGKIKTNIPSRIAFAVSSYIDSRIILDTMGAEKLLGKGDMLFMPMGESKPTRLQGAFISDKEVEAVAEFVKGNSEVRYDEDITEKINSETEIDTDMDDCDELLPKAIEIAIASGSISTSMVQRRLGVGYARAGRIIDQMEARGIISGADGSKPRNVLVTADDLK